MYQMPGNDASGNDPARNGVPVVAFFALLGLSLVGGVYPSPSSADATDSDLRVADERTEVENREPPSFSLHVRAEEGVRSGVRDRGGRFVFSHPCAATARLGSGTCGCLCVSAPPIFVDGFESGDTSAWSEVVP